MAGGIYKQRFNQFSQLIGTHRRVEIIAVPEPGVYVALECLLRQRQLLAMAVVDTQFRRQVIGIDVDRTVDPDPDLQR
ncbi:hypothetical protein, partial [Pseudomonas viridiflava]|uniref:hypothetical protein n=1 Tax=Pseudomonas viridiflava TaxID=33069 RepID=UPI0019CFACE1